MFHDMVFIYIKHLFEQKTFAHNFMLIYNFVMDSIRTKHLLTKLSVTQDGHPSDPLLFYL